MTTTRTPQTDFHNRLRILKSIDRSELAAVDVYLSDLEWAQVVVDPFTFFIRCGDFIADAIWTILEARS